MSSTRFLDPKLLVKVMELWELEYCMVDPGKMVPTAAASLVLNWS